MVISRTAAAALIALALATVALMPAPAAAQEPECVRLLHGTTPNRNLAVLARAAEGDDRVEFRYATAQALALLTQFTGCRRSPDDFGHRPLEELNAFADRLVDFAIANAGNEHILFEVRFLFREAARPDESEGHVPYAGAFDALQRMYQNGVAKLRDLMSVDLDRGMALAVGSLESGEIPRRSVCPFLRMVVQFGELVLFDDGALEIELAESADYNADIPPVPPGYYGAARSLADELVAEGIIEENCGGLLGTITVDGIAVEMPGEAPPPILKRRKRS